MNEPKTQVALLPEPQMMNPIQLLQIAVAKGVDTEQLKELMILQREWKAEQARDAFFQAMNAFRAEAINIVKTKQVAFKDVSYKHATLANIVDATAPALSKHGLSHRWETKQEGQLITVSCIVTHELGHSAQTSLSAGPDNSGSKNSIQQIGSTVSYLQRYTFMAITGLAAKDQDDDGIATGARVEPKQIEPKRMKAIVGGLNKAVTEQDAESAKKIWAELTNDEKELVWTELRSLTAMRAAIKKLLAKALPPADLAGWSLELLNGAKDADAVLAAWTTIQDAYAANDVLPPGDVETYYIDRKQVLAVP